MKKTIFIFSGLTLCILGLSKLSEFSIIKNSSGGVGSNEFFIVVSAFLFVGMGVYLSRLFRKPVSAQSTGKTVNQDKLIQAGLSKREHQVLTLMAQGLSNNEIGKELFISENTVKTHVSRLLSKLNARRRTHAVQIARDLEII